MTTIRDTLSDLEDFANHHRPLILFIVLNNPSIETIKYMLIKKGFGVEILQCATKEHIDLHYQTPDLIILDANIPGSNTSEFVSHLKSSENTLNTPLIIITDNNINCKEYLSIADDCIVKPVNNVSLLRCISTHLKIRRQNLLLQKQAEQLHLANNQLKSEIEKRTKLETDLKKSHEELETRIKKRISELVLVNENLKSEILERKKTEELLKKRNAELERMERLIVGRELKMIELKNKIHELETRLKK